MPQFTDPSPIVEAGAFTLMDAGTAVPFLADLLRGTPQIRDAHFWAMLPGESVDSGSERIAYLADRVVPEVRAALAG